jgi:phytoene synthase
VVEGWAACRRVIAQHSKSFDLASRLLPPGRRDEVAALYAWCRICDDAIDLAPAHEQAAALEGLRARLTEVYGDGPLGDPVLACFREVVRRRQIPIAYPVELLDGMAMDATHAHYETIDELLVYCWRVAGTVGLMMCHVMGVSDERAAAHAAHLGIGMQLTNVCRDVVEDWQRGRVYVPACLLGPSLGEWLRQNARQPGTRPALPEAARPAFARAVGVLLARAERYYASADAGIAYLEPRSALAVRTARLVYAEIGRRIEARGCDVMLGRAVVPASRKLRLAGSALRRFVAERRSWSPSELRAPRAVLQCGDAVRLA